MAYLAAYPGTERSARSQGSRLLQRPDVAAALLELDGAVLAKLDITADTVLQELAAKAFSSMGDFVTVDGVSAVLDLTAVTKRQWSAVQQIKIGKDGDVTLKLYDARAALVDLGKHLGLFTGFSTPADPTNPESHLSPLEVAQRLAFLLTQGVQLGQKALQKPLH